jgi:hypothetical protein
MPIPYTFPWALHPLEDWIIKELNRRSSERGMNPVEDIKNDIYSGPKTAWSRVFSNGVSSLATDGQQGFVMGGTEGFNDSYGFNTNNKVVIGVDATGKPHMVDAIGTTTVTVDQGKKQISTDLPHRPPPSIVSVETKFSGGANSSFNALCRETTITWKCYSLAQLEYLTPYFLTPRISILVEWGWNYYDTISLVDLSDIDWLYEIYLGKWEYTGKWIERSNGNYDLAMGIIKDYSFTLNEFGGYDCTTVIINANYLLEGQSYQNKNSTTVDSATKETLKIKDFKEFVFRDIDNLEIKPKTKNAERDVANILKIKTTGKVFRSEAKYWLRMDLIQEIINTFFQITLTTPADNLTDVGCMKFDISDVPICAHPFLKSVNKEILFPNQYAPRFTSIDDTATGRSLGTVRINSEGDGEYYTLFPSIRTITEKGYSDIYDDLKTVINPTSANSFPVFKEYTGPEERGKAKAGYWGYLQDVFVSVDIFKSLVESQDTAKTLLESLLQLISRAMCDITQLQLRPSSLNNNVYTAIDLNFSPKFDDLPIITLVSNNSAFIRSADFSVKLSGEMANQMVMQSTSGRELPATYGTSTVDEKTIVVSRFAKGDRLFERGVIPPSKVTLSSVASENPKSKQERKFTVDESNKEFTLHKIQDGRTTLYYIIAEKNPAFMKNIVSDKADKNSMYINSAIMPGTNFTMELLGIGGITFLSQFLLAHVPSAYNYDKCVWQVSDVKQRIENKVWTTTVVAQARPRSTII